MSARSHLSDQELTLVIDGELEGARAIAAREHLSQCWSCRVRRDELEQAIAGFVRVHRDSQPPRIPPPEGPAARLRAEMAMLAGRPEPRAPFRLATAFVVMLAAAGSVLGVIWLTGQRAAAGPLPDSRLTPGATRLISRDQVCGVPADDDGRTVPAELAMRVFEQYRIAPRPNAYEVDYLVSPTLGGADDIRNLWPQPYAEGEWNSRVKDALEDHLRHMVCEGRLDLATAQHDIASDWIAAYRKYFRTRRPLAAHALFVKDPAWQ